jgi:hypothetical protein
MIATATDFRIPVMTWVEASWEEAGGSPQTVAARMENKSAGGACIRIKTPIPVGLKLRIHWRFEHFSGTAKYCRKDGIEYLVGIHRDAIAENAVVAPPASADVAQPPIANSAEPTLASQPIPSPKKRGQKPVGIAIVERATAAVAIPQPAIVEVYVPPKARTEEIQARGSAAGSRPQDFDAAATIRPRRNMPSGETKEGRKPMRRKWLDLSPWGDKEKSPAADPVENSDGQHAGERSARSTGSFQKETVMSNANQSFEKAPLHSAPDAASFQVELLPMEDIYRAAGIMAPRKGYSITKVVEMLHSEHLRGASKEMKRAALLTALDAAGIPLDEIQKDAKARQDALDSHESQQTRQVEAEWARKAEEVIQIQAELESTKAHYIARINRNVESVAREKATFNSWLALKQQECQNMKEALELCLKPSVAEPSTVTSPDVTLSKGAAAGVKQESTNGTIQ